MQPWALMSIATPQVPQVSWQKPLAEMKQWPHLPASIPGSNDTDGLSSQGCFQAKPAVGSKKQHTLQAAGNQAAPCTVAAHALTPLLLLCAGELGVGQHIRAGRLRCQDCTQVRQRCIRQYDSHSNGGGAALGRLGPDSSAEMLLTRLNAYACRLWGRRGGGRSVGNAGCSARTYIAAARSLPL